LAIRIFDHCHFISFSFFFFFFFFFSVFSVTPW